MSNRKQPTLNEWMLANPDLLGWESITALPLAQANALLLQAHLRRMSQGETISDLGGAIEMQMSDIVYHLAGYQLSAPQLNVETASYLSARVQMQASLQGGTLVQTELPDKVLSLSVHDPLDDLALSQQLYPAGEQGALLMDLAEGEDTRLAVGEVAVEQQQAGAWLLGEFRRIKEQAPEKPAYALVGSQSEVPALRFGEVNLRSQLDAEGKHPALLVFASSAYGHGGRFPGEAGNFPSLLLPGQPAGEATQLLGLQLLHRIALLKGFQGLLEDGEVLLEQDNDGLLTRAVATAGSLRVAPTHYESRDYIFNGKAFELPAEGGLEATFMLQAGQMHWQAPCSLEFECKLRGAGAPRMFTATFALNLLYRYYLVENTEPGQGMLEGQFFAPWPQAQEAIALSGLPGDIDAEMKAQCEDFAAHAVKQAILLGMAQQLDAASPEQWLAAQRLAEVGSVSPLRWEMPNALAVFGALGHGATFTIRNPAMMVVAGAKEPVRFEVDNPPEQALTWTLESLPDSPDDLGTIVEGAYHAPPRYTLQGRSGRVLVVASDGNGALAAAVVTVLRHELSANPFICTVHANGNQLLSASTFGEVAVQWEIANKVPGESGELAVEAQGRQCRYRAGPVVADKTYVLDEIKVQGTGDAQSLFVLVTQYTPALVVKLADEPGADGRVQFVASANGRPVPAKWRLAVGPGAIDEDTGLYQPGSSADTPGILVFAEFDAGDMGIFEGHLILPLHMLRFPALGRQLLVAPAERTRFASH